MCGIAGIVGTSGVNQRIYDALTVLQHRGQDAAGIATVADGELFVRKSQGLVRDVFQQHHMLELKGNIGIGHVRYPTAGFDNAAEAQPFYVNAPYGICLAHNGNLTNARELGEILEREDRRHLNTSSDSEVLLNVLASELQRVGTPRVMPADIFAAVSAVYRRCRGGYAVVAMVIGHGLLGFRDPNGIRPLVLGQRETPKGAEWMLASESVALDMLGFKLVRDVAPGEVVYIDTHGRLHSQVCVATTKHAPCIFEYVYFARPDSLIDNISVHRARMRMGERLADKILRERADHHIDVVIPIPDTSRTSAMQVAQRLDVKYREGFVKNRYVGRTFIMPGQEQRSKSVRSKLNAIDLEFRNKNVLLVDDSIVRGTTSAQIIDLAREAGAKKVYFASAAPPVKFPNVYGIDMPAASELVASNRTDAEVAEVIGADWLIYQDLEDLIQACVHDHSSIREFDTSCFSGHYVTGDVTPEYLARLQAERSDLAKASRRDGDRNGLKVVKLEPPSGTQPDAMNARRILLDVFDVALRAVDGRAKVDHFLREATLTAPIEVFAIGKAASSMARGAQVALGPAVERMLVITKDGHTDPALDRVPGVTQLQSAHPVPDLRSFSNGAELQERVRSLREDIFPLFLISGGSSSLVESLRDGVSLDEVTALNVQGLSSGWDIARLNLARARLSRIKGGGIARLLRERRALALFISDVPGDDPDVIGSGLLGHDVGIADSIERHVIATIETAVRAVQEGARAHGLDLEMVSTRFDGDVEAVAGEILARLRASDCDGVVWGGESTVTLPERHGRGGRNTHLALSFARQLRAGEPWMLLAAGTDGTDGPTDDAGAIVDAQTIERATLAGCDVERAWREFDSGTALEAAEDLVHTGPTGTNVGDILIAIKQSANSLRGRPMPRML